MANTTTGGSINGVPFEFDFTGRGVSPRFRISGTSLDFGDVPVGSSVDQSIGVTNIGLAPVVVSMAGGAAATFGGVQDCQGVTLNVGATCHITYTFAPTSGGGVTATTGGSINGQTFTFAFRGNGVPPTFRISATDFDFGEVVVGQSVDQTVDVVNTSTVPVTVSMAGGAAGVFGGVQNCQSVSLAPGAGCQITYTFQPTATGTATSTTGGSINGQSFAFSFKGTGIATAGARTVPFRISPIGFDFGNVQTGYSVEQTVDVTNVSSAAIVVSMAGGAAGAFGGVQNCQNVSLAPGASCQITYTFAPTAAGVATATTGGSINGQSFAFAFKGNGVNPSFRVSPTALDFGKLQVGTSVDQSITVTNVSGHAAVISMAGGAAGTFGGVQDCQGVSLAPGAACHITYTFAPTATGVVTGTTGGSINGQSFAFSFAGEGIAPHFRITPFNFDFGPRPIGSSTDQVVTVTNDGVAPALISMAGGAAGPFGGVQNCERTTLAIGGSCQITYTFAPTSPGPVSATAGGTITGQPFAFTMYGNGNGTLFTFGTFSGPLANRGAVRGGSTLAVLFTFNNADGSTLSASDAEALATACRVQVVFSGAAGTPLCATYDPVAGVFQANIKTDKSLAAGSYTVTANLMSADGTTVLAHGTMTLTIS